MLEIIRLVSLFPSVDINNKKYNGIFFEQPKICGKCKTTCWQFISETKDKVSHFTCPSGISLVLLKFTYGDILCNGLIVKIVNSNCPSQLRKLLQSQKVSYDEIKKWHNNITTNLPLIESLAEQKASELVDSLHNVKAAVNVVNRNTESLVATLSGNSDEEKIDNAAPPLKSLLKSVELLNSGLPLASILNNPASASYGQKRSCPVYKIFHKMVRLFEEIAAHKLIFIKIYGTSYNSPLCYDSFESIALVLIDNAVKYSEKGKEVEVIVSDISNGGVEVCIKSYGLVVPENERDQIFKKRYRVEHSKRISSSGSGLGLYIASIVADVHNFKIEYACEQDKKNPMYGTNIFSFKVTDTLKS